MIAEAWALRYRSGRLDVLRGGAWCRRDRRARHTRRRRPVRRDVPAAKLATATVRWLGPLVAMLGQRSGRDQQHTKQRNS